MDQTQAQQQEPSGLGRLWSIVSSPTRRIVAVNVVLLMALVSISIGPGAGAPPSTQTGRARGEYTMLSGKTNTGSTYAIYVLDAANQELVSLRWDSSRQKLVTIGYRNLDADAKAPPTR